MPLVPVSAGFPASGTYLRYMDSAVKQYRFMRLMERQLPLLYPRRLGSVASGSTTSDVSLDELNPSKEKKHRYLVYMGVGPGARYYVWHPFDVKILKWDETPIEDVAPDLTAHLTYEESPLDAPTFPMWIEPDRYPLINAKNISDHTIVPEVFFLGCKYVVKLQEDLSQVELAELQQEKRPYLPISFGGEI